VFCLEPFFPRLDRCFHSGEVHGGPAALSMGTDEGVGRTGQRLAVDSSASVSLTYHCKKSRVDETRTSGVPQCHIGLPDIYHRNADGTSFGSVILLPSAILRRVGVDFLEIVPSSTSASASTVRHRHTYIESACIYGGSRPPHSSVQLEKATSAVHPRRLAHRSHVPPCRPHRPPSPPPQCPLSPPTVLHSALRSSLLDPDVFFDPPTPLLGPHRAVSATPISASLGSFQPTPSPGSFIAGVLRDDQDSRARRGEADGLQLEGIDGDQGDGEDDEGDCRECGAGQAVLVRR
jgi:hypothetical protein